MLLLIGRLNLGLSGFDSAVEILPFVFCFGQLYMLSIVSSHLVLGLLKILHIQVVNDPLVHKKLVFKLTLVMIFNPPRER